MPSLRWTPALLYELEETAPIRVLTNPQLAANPNLKPEAVILREGRVFGTVPLDPDPQSFTFRGETAPWSPAIMKCACASPACLMA